MHPTRNSAVLIVTGSSGRVMPGVRRSNLGLTGEWRAYVQNGVCPKCSSREVYHSDATGEAHGVSVARSQPYMRLYKDARWVPDVWMIELSYYVCRFCGYFETYVRDVGELSRLDACTNWRRVDGES
jgi:predicted nucleic-acid-binding Zn-ribbon protein